MPRLIAPDEVAIAVYQLTAEIFANPQEDPARFMSQASPEEAAPPGMSVQCATGNQPYPPELSVMSKLLSPHIYEAISKRRVLAPASSGIESHFPESVPFSNNVPPPDPTPSVPASSQIDIVASQGREPPALSQDLPTPQPSRRRVSANQATFLQLPISLNMPFDETFLCLSVYENRDSRARLSR